MKFGTWNVKSLYRSGSFTAVARELVRYKLDLERRKRGAYRGWVGEA